MDDGCSDPVGSVVVEWSESWVEHSGGSQSKIEANKTEGEGE